MIIEIAAVILVVSAFLAVYLDDAVYSIVSLTVTIMSVALLYLLNQADIAAIFQFAVGVGALAILFLSGEMLSEGESKQRLLNIVSVTAIALLVSIVPIFFSVGVVPSQLTTQLQVSDVLWNLRGIDVIAQGLVILTVAIGLSIVLHGRKGEDI